MNTPPTHLPAHYRFTHHSPIDADDGFLGMWQYLDGRSDLEVRTRLGVGVDDFGAPTAHPTVSGHRATVSAESYERCVRWISHPGYLREVCSLDPSHRYLSVAELVRISDSVR